MILFKSNNTKHLTGFISFRGENMTVISTTASLEAKLYFFSENSKKQVKISWH